MNQKGWSLDCGDADDDYHHCGDDNLDDDCPGLALMGASLSLHSQSCTTVGGKNLMGNNLHEVGVKRKLILKNDILGWKTRMDNGHDDMMRARVRFVGVVRNLYMVI